MAFLEYRNKSSMKRKFQATKNSIFVYGFSIMGQGITWKGFSAEAKVIKNF